jgi:hypothetical protein
LKSYAGSDHAFRRRGGYSANSSSNATGSFRSRRFRHMPSG